MDQFVHGRFPYCRREFGSMQHDNEGAFDEEIIAIGQLDRPYSQSSSTNSNRDTRERVDEAYEDVDITDVLKQGLGGPQGGEGRVSSASSDQNSSESIVLPPGQSGNQI